jgi:hypothetical protein
MLNLAPGAKMGVCVSLVGYVNASLSVDDKSRESVGLLVRGQSRAGSWPAVGPCTISMANTCTLLRFAHGYRRL